MGAIRGDQVIGGVDGRLNADSTGFLWEETNQNISSCFLYTFLCSSCDFRQTSQRRWYLSIVQVAEASDDLLLVQLIGFELHAPHGLHGAVILQALLPSELRLHGRPLLQTVQVAFLKSIISQIDFHFVVVFLW